MKTIKFIWLAAIIAILSACQKDEITVNLRTAGSLNVQLMDSTGTKFDNVKVHLYSYYYTSSSYSTLSYSGEIDTKRTDSNGNVNFGTIAQGTYYIVTDTIKKGNKKFLISKAVQIISGDSKNVVLNPYEYVGTLKLSLYIYTNGLTDTLARTKIKVALVNSLDYSNSLNRIQVINKAVAIKSFNSNGTVEFNNIPANIRYYPYVYVDNNDTIGSWSENGSVMVAKDDIYSSTVSTYLTKLIVPKTNLSLTIQYYSSGYKPVSSANVALIRYNDYSNNNLYNASVSTILTYAIKTGITNTSGNVIFNDIPSYEEYYAFIYYSASLNTWVSSYMYVSSGSTYNFTRTVTGSDLGL